MIVKLLWVFRKPFAVKWIMKLNWFKKEISVKLAPSVFHPPPKTEPHGMLLRLGFFSGLICRAAGADKDA